MGAFFMSLGFVLFASSLLAGGCGGGSQHDRPFRAVAVDNGRMAVAGRFRDRKGREGRASADSVLPTGCTEDLLYGMHWGGSVAGPGKARHAGASSPYGRRTPPGKDRKNVPQSRHSN